MTEWVSDTDSAEWVWSSQCHSVSECDTDSQTQALGSNSQWMTQTSDISDGVTVTVSDFTTLGLLSELGQCEWVWISLIILIQLSTSSEARVRLSVFDLGLELSKWFYRIHKKLHFWNKPQMYHLCLNAYL